MKKISGVQFSALWNNGVNFQFSSNFENTIKIISNQTLQIQCKMSISEIKNLGFSINKKNNSIKIKLK